MHRTHSTVYSSICLSEGVLPWRKGGEISFTTTQFLVV